MIGRYHVIGRIGAGGMAEILLAKVLGPGGFERQVVIKRVLPHLVNESEFRDMFLDEARIVAGIHHPNVVQVHELGREEGELYLVMEYLAGESVRSLSKRAAARRVPLDLGLCAHVVAESCAGLHAAHEFTGPDGKPLQVVHRDVCPNNLIVTYDGAVKVVDFGIAQAADRFTLTEAGQVKGKAAYMSPEQCLRRPVDPRTDVFALGVVLYELSTGYRLYDGALESRILSCLQKEEVRPPSRVARDYPPELERICLRALRFDPDERFGSAAEMRRELVLFQRARAADVLPEQQLKTCMHTLFRDRIEEKADLLNRLRAGTGVSYIPAAEISDEVSQPLVDTIREVRGALAVPDTLVDHSLGARDTTSVPMLRPKGAFRAWALGAVVAICLVGGLGFLFATQPAHGARQLVRSSQVSPALPAAAREAPPARVVPAQVTVQLASQPPGARAWINGSYRGNTPLSVSLPRGTAPVSLRLELARHTALVQTLVPDVDQRLSLALAPVQSAAKPSTAEQPEAPGKALPKRRRSGKPSNKAGEEFFLFE